jgi:hypothetical protein
LHLRGGPHLLSLQNLIVGDLRYPPLGCSSWTKLTPGICYTSRSPFTCKICSTLDNVGHRKVFCARVHLRNQNKQFTLLPLTRSCDETRLWSRFECLITLLRRVRLASVLSTARNPLSLPQLLAVMAWNIDYEHDSEEVVLLKRHIAEQGRRHRHPPGFQSPRLTLHHCLR